MVLDENLRGEKLHFILRATLMSVCSVMATDPVVMITLPFGTRGKFSRIHLLGTMNVSIKFCTAPSFQIFCRISGST